MLIMIFKASDYLYATLFIKIVNIIQSHFRYTPLPRGVEQNLNPQDQLAVQFEIELARKLQVLRFSVTELLFK